MNGNKNLWLSSPCSFIGILLCLICFGSGRHCLSMLQPSRSIKGIRSNSVNIVFRLLIDIISKILMYIHVHFFFGIPIPSWYTHVNVSFTMWFLTINMFTTFQNQFLDSLTYLFYLLSFQFQGCWTLPMASQAKPPPRNPFIMSLGVSLLELLTWLAGRHGP